jgi:type II secretory pathway pseudopilin PulG
MILHQPSAISIWIRCQKNKTQGMTLIEFLVVAFVIVTLAAVALPSLLSCNTGKVKQVEARNTVGAMNRAQQAYNLEKGGFAGSIDKLGIGIRTETTNYSYSIRVTKGAAFHYAITKQPNFKSYVGAVWTETTNINGKKEDTTRAIMCEAEKPVAAATKPADPVYENGGYVCGEGTVRLGV